MKKINIIFLGLFMLIFTGCAGAQVVDSCPMPKTTICPSAAELYAESLTNFLNKLLQTNGLEINKNISYNFVTHKGPVIYFGVTSNIEMSKEDKLSMSERFSKVNSCLDWSVVIPGVVFVNRFDSIEVARFECDEYLK